MARYDEWRQQEGRDGSPRFGPGQRFRGDPGGRSRGWEHSGGGPPGRDFQGYGGQWGREGGRGRYGGDFRGGDPGRWSEGRGRGDPGWEFRSSPQPGYQRWDRWGGGGYDEPRWAEWRPGGGGNDFQGHPDALHLEDQDAFGEPMDDDEIRAAVQQNLRIDRYLPSDGIDVEVEDGVVTLAGEVDDYLHARYAWDDAWDTRGVRGVLSRLEVRNTDAAEEDESDSEQEEGG
jgi:hypothetical protein